MINIQRDENQYLKKVLMNIWTVLTKKIKNI